ncbi:hypothetical protein BV25DRAFT_487703 [Artomyces pyxidatus]|uniref:Uncharacterized protein n=1 Tax=Artomyces pyxidatus TaxID=48021 RepID=A0ACB8T3A0_9AGAM|nr:hypothetical protein BV25DRAFT_487703 [Artomyces pyxidatus]
MGTHLAIKWTTSANFSDHKRSPPPPNRPPRAIMQRNLSSRSPSPDDSDIDTTQPLMTTRRAAAPLTSNIRPATARIAGADTQPPHLPPSPQSPQSALPGLPDPQQGHYAYTGYGTQHAGYGAQAYPASGQHATHAQYAAGHPQYATQPQYPAYAQHAQHAHGQYAQYQQTLQPQQQAQYQQQTYQQQAHYQQQGQYHQHAQHQAQYQYQYPPQQQAGMYAGHATAYQGYTGRYDHAVLNQTGQGATGSSVYPPHGSTPATHNAAASSSQMTGGSMGAQGPGPTEDPNEQDWYRDRYEQERRGGRRQD